jgi:ABC-type sugar transport system permease subunit
MSLYRKIFKEALHATWKNKYLWFFGLFAALFGTSSDYEIISRFLTGDSSVFGWQAIQGTNVLSIQTFRTISDFMTEDPLSFMLTMFVALFILVLVVFLVWLATVSQVALVTNAAALSAGKKTGFKDGIEAGGKNFWPVFGLNIFNKALISIVFLIVGLPLALSAGRSLVAYNFFYLLVFIVFVPVAIIISFIVKYAIAYKVIKSKSLLDSLKKSWQLFVENWLVSVEMAFVLFALNFFYGLAVLLLMLVLASIANLFPQPTLARPGKSGASLRLRERRGR